MGVTHVLSAVQPFEFTVHVLTMGRPITPLDWEQASVRVKQRTFETPDFQPLSIELLHEGADWIYAALKENHNSDGSFQPGHRKPNKVYVHCKSGVGRSMSMVVAYLLKYRGFSFEEAFSLLKSRRPQISRPDGKQGEQLRIFAE